MNTASLRGMVVVLLLGAITVPGIAEESPGKPSKVRVGLASLSRAKDIADGVKKINASLVESGKKDVDVVCFPELYLPGMRGFDKQMPPLDQPGMERAIKQIAKSCRANNVAGIVGVEWLTKRGLENRAYVIDRRGKVLGYQTKNQITPGWESDTYVPDGKRRMFDLDGMRFGISICHEGWRYPETVRWAAVRGAQVVFQPQVTGSDYRETAPPAKWGESFYEKAMACRAEENSVYFVSVNRTMRLQNSASSVVDPDGNLVKFTPRGEEKLLVADLDLTKATGFYAGRYQPHLYEERNQTSADGKQRSKSTVPSPGEITEIIVERGVSNEPQPKNDDVHLRRKNGTVQFQRLATTLVKQGFFELKETYGRSVPDGPSMQLVVVYGKQKKAVKRLFEGELDDAWEFEMLIRGVNAQISRAK